jgi:hypothetical protein
MLNVYCTNLYKKSYKKGALQSHCNRVNSEKRSKMDYYSIELCAGAGGQALGLEKAGFKHVVM